MISCFLRNEANQGTTRSGRARHGRGPLLHGRVGTLKTVTETRQRDSPDDPTDEATEEVLHGEGSKEVQKAYVIVNN